MYPIEIKNRKTLSNDRYPLEQITFERADKKGEAGEHHREVYFRSDAVSVLLFDPRQRQILLIRQFRLPVFLHEGGNGFLLEACAGIIDEGESPEQTVVRETLEETGYEPFHIVKVGLTYVSPAYCMERIHLFLAEIDLENKKEQGGGLEHEGEEIDPVIITYEKARQLLLTGGIHDVKTKTLMQDFLLRYPQA